MDIPEFSEEDSWSNYQLGAQEKVGLALKSLVRAVADGLNYEWMVDRTDRDRIAGSITDELQWLVRTDFLQRIIAAELGPGGIGTDEES